MADIVTILVDKVALPVLSGAGGVGLSIWRMSASVSRRLEAVERAWKQFNEIDYPRERGEILAALKTLRQDITKELNKIHSDDTRSAKERIDARRLHANLSERVTQLEFYLENCDKSVQDLRDQLGTFVREQTELWQSMSRSMGQLEGFVKGVTNRSDHGPFPTK